jgi:hypothetical protein
MAWQIAAPQAVHDGSLDLGQMERHAHVAQALVQAFERFQRAQVNVVDGRAHQNHMAQVRVGGATFQHQIFQIPRIGEIEAFIDAQGQDGWNRFDMETLDVTEMLGPRYAAHFGHMRARGAPQMQNQRQKHTGHDALFHPQ